MTSPGALTTRLGRALATGAIAAGLLTVAPLPASSGACVINAPCNSSVSAKYNETTKKMTVTWTNATGADAPPGQVVWSYSSATDSFGKLADYYANGRWFQSFTGGTSVTFTPTNQRTYEFDPPTGNFYVQVFYFCDEPCNTYCPDDEYGCFFISLYSEAGPGTIVTSGGDDGGDDDDGAESHQDEVGSDIKLIKQGLKTFGATLDWYDKYKSNSECVREWEKGHVVLGGLEDILKEYKALDNSTRGEDWTNKDVFTFRRLKSRADFRWGQARATARKLASNDCPVREEAPDPPKKLKGQTFCVLSPAQPRCKLD